MAVIEKGEQIKNLAELIDSVDKEDYFFFDDVAVETKWVKEQTLVFLYDNIAKGLIYKPKTKRERKIVEAVKDDKERVTSKEQAN